MVQNKSFRDNTLSNTTAELGSIILIRSHNGSDDPEDDTPTNLDELARTLTMLNYDVKVISCNKTIETSSRVFKVAQSIPKSIWGYFKTPFAVTKLFMIAALILIYKKSMKPIVVVVEELTYIIPLLNILGNIKIIYVEDVLKNVPIVDQIDDYRSRNRRHQLYYLKYVQKVVVSCKTSKYILESEELNINKRPILLYPNVETPEFLDETFIPAAHILNTLNHDSVILLTFGDYVPENNFNFAIDCFERLQKKFRNHRYLYENMYFVICGTCNNRKELDYMHHLMSKRINTTNLIFIRNMPYVLRKALLKLARCILFPSIIYNHDQMLLMQCLRMGKIVIATECFVTDDLIQHGSNGYICDATVRDFVFYITKILTEPSAHRALAKTIKTLFCDYYGECQYVTAVKSIFENLDLSGEILQSESHDLSVMKNSYFIQEFDQNEIPAIQFVPFSSINYIPLDDDIKFIPDEDEFMRDIGMNIMSTPRRNSSNTTAQKDLDTDTTESEDSRGSSLFSRDEPDILPYYNIPVNADEEISKYRSLYVIPEEDGEENDTDLDSEDSSNQTFFTVSEIMEGIEMLDEEFEEKFSGDSNSSVGISFGESSISDITEVEEDIQIFNDESINEEIDQYSDTSDEYPCHQTYIIDEEGIEVIEMVEEENGEEITRDLSDEYSLNEILLSVSDETDGYEVLPQETQETNEALEQFHTMTNDSNTFFPRTYSFTLPEQEESWNFRRTRSYSLPRCWRPLENGSHG